MLDVCLLNLHFLLHSLSLNTKLIMLLLCAVILDFSHLETLAYTYLGFYFFQGVFINCAFIEPFGLTLIEVAAVAKFPFFYILPCSWLFDVYTLLLARLLHMVYQWLLPEMVGLLTYIGYFCTSILCLLRNLF
jgi:hypothetical protein